MSKNITSATIQFTKAVFIRLFCLFQLRDDEVIGGEKKYFQTLNK